MKRPFPLLFSIVIVIFASVLMIPHTLVVNAERSDETDGQRIVVFETFLRPT